jgi:hypothetical protein
MKVFVVLVMMVLVAASAVADANLAVAADVTSVAVQVVDGTSEPAVLLLSGSLLLGLAGAVRRFTF